MNDNENNILLDYKLGDNLSKIQLKYGGSRKTIRKILFDNKLIDSIEPKRKTYFIGSVNLEVKKNILLEYQTEKNITELSEKFNIPVMSIYNLLRKEKVFDNKFGVEIQRNKVRKYEINEHYFDKIDSEEKAYFLGILYADGCNMVDHTEVSLRLQEDDYEILDKLNKLLQPTKPIHKIKEKGNQKAQYRLLINSKLISYRLNELGITQNKTFTTTFPSFLSSDLHRHFIRGYFDGDGSVSYNIINHQIQFGFTGTENIILGIQNILTNEISLNKNKLSIRHPERNNNIRSLNYCGNSIAKYFYNYIYNDSHIFMKRKQEKFNKHLI